MGNYLQSAYIDTVEIFLISTNTAEENFKLVDYSNWIYTMKEIYGKEKNLPRHATMKDFLISDYKDFHQWIAKNKHQVTSNN